MKTRARRVLLSAVLALIPAGAASSQQEPAQGPQPRDSVPPGAPVVFRGDTLLLVYGRIGAFTAEERAGAIAERLRTLGRGVGRRADSVALVDGETHTDLVIGDVVVMTVLNVDAAPMGRPRSEVAGEYAVMITRALQLASSRRTLQALLVGALGTLLATAVLLTLLKVISWVFPRVYAVLESWRGTRIPSLRIQRLELLSSNRLTDVLLGAARGIRVALVVVLLYFYLPLVLRLFPWTSHLSGRILGYVVSPLRQAGSAFINYLPSLFFIAVITAITWYVIRFVHLLFNAVRTGAVAIPGFYREWADPTFKIVRFLILAFALVVLFPYLPGAGSEAFRGVSIFLGVLLSLGSSSAIANVVAGVVLMYTRAFEIGDRVKIADTAGEVREKTLLATRVRTIKNVDITVPNAMVLGSHIINYSSEGRRGRLILHTSVTIGYDVPWRTVHELLLAAARATDNIGDEPVPFVLQTSLDDFYVRYELNAYTNRPEGMAQTYSDLHQNIQESFNEAGVEIMSPHYGALRDGNQVAIPTDYLPKSYQAPVFRVGPFGIQGQTSPAGGG